MKLADLASQARQNSNPSPLRDRNPSNVESGRRAGEESPDSALLRIACGSMSSSTTRERNGMDGTSVSDSTTSAAHPVLNDFTLYWQSKSPKYNGDFDIYIWQPYRKPPPFDYVKVHIVNKETTRNLKMLLLFNEARSLWAFRSRHQQCTPQRAADEAWPPSTELVTSISAVLETIISDMVEFLQCCSKEVTRLV